MGRKPRESLGGWRLLFDGAGSVEDVLRIVRDHVSMWRPDEIAELPAACRPGHFANADEVTAYATLLAQVETKANGSMPARFESLAKFFKLASARLTALASRVR